MSGATPSGSPAALVPVTSRKFERLMPARRTPVGASSAMISGDMAPPPFQERSSVFPCRPGRGKTFLAAGSGGRSSCRVGALGRILLDGEIGDVAAGHLVDGLGDVG